MGLSQRLRHLEHTTLDPWFERRLRRIVGPTGENVLSTHRRHWLVLVGPAVVAGVGSVAMLVASQPRTWLLLFAIGAVVLDRWRHSWSDLRTVGGAAVWLVPLWLTSDLRSDLFRACAILALLVYLLVVLARWWCEVLVLTETALWRLWGVVTTASPKAPLTSLLFQDVRQSITEQALHCGTLRFDTASDKDDPLASYGPISEPFEVSAKIHLQRLEVARAGRTAAVLPPTQPTPAQPPTRPTPTQK